MGKNWLVSETSQAVDQYGDNFLILLNLNSTIIIFLNF